MNAPKAKAKLHVKTGDTVVVISGKDKGAQGEAFPLLPGSSHPLLFIHKGIPLINPNT
jgi:hypothetical protein